MRYFSWVQIDERGYDLKPEPNKAAVTVFEPETRAVRTGLLDMRGNPLMKDDTPPPAAFIRFGEH